MSGAGHDSLAENILQSKFALVQMFQFAVFDLLFVSLELLGICSRRLVRRRCASNKGKSPAKEEQLGMIEGEEGASTAMMPSLSG